MTDLLDFLLEEKNRELERPLAHGREASVAYRRAAALEKCPVCRETWLVLAEVADRAVEASEFSDHLARHPALQELERQLLVAAEHLHLFSLLGRIIGKVRGWAK